jgi:para-aminobenzoate synthetase / 4-amino-4-deoxychorismate lyase
VSAPAPWARFDDLRSGTAWRFGPPDRVVTAAGPGQVAGALDEVDRAVRSGAWAFGYLGYEAAPGLDPALVTREPDPDGPPPLWFGLGGPPEPAPVLAPGGDYRASPWTPAWGPGEHAAAVAGVRDRIAAGLTYQVNLTTRLHASFDGDPAGLYADLALAQRGAHAGYLDTGRFAVACASPELLLSRDGEAVVSGPMKGTSVRGRDLAEDLELAGRLRADTKERAENVMIVDLVRNDLGRVARVGSVRVPQLCAVERYETVLQMTSRVSAEVPGTVGLVELLRAVFPCGSVTGAPKAAAMAVIRELESAPRGVYCGAVGLVAPPGRRPGTRFAVAIRTAVVDRARGRAEYGTGGGITWSSRAGAEHAELLAKAAILTRRDEPFELLETMAYRPGQGICHRDRHLRRLARSAEYFGFVLDDRVARALDAERARTEPAVLRLSLARDGTADVRARPLPPPPAGPVALAVDPEPVDSRLPWAYHKTTRRAPYDVRRARHPRVDDVLLVNERGEVTESTVANLAVRLDGRWWTPALRSGCLPGIERERLIEAGTLRERLLRPDDLERAGSLALVSSVRGWRPAKLA